MTASVFACLCAQAVAAAAAEGWGRPAPRGDTPAFWQQIRFSDYDGAPLTNFPLKVVLKTEWLGFSYDGFISPADGADLRVLDATAERELNHEIERWDTGAVSFVWVQVPVLIGSSFIWVHWGDPAHSNMPPCTTNGSVWTEGYAAVWHLSQTGTEVRLDSTTNGNHGVPRNYEGAHATQGPVDGADLLDGVDDYVDCGNPDSLRITNTITLEGWVRFTGEISAAVIGKWTYSPYSYLLQVMPRRWMGGGYFGSGVFFDLGDASGGQHWVGGWQQLDDNAWHYIAGVYDGSGMRAYADGVAEEGLGSSFTGPIAIRDTPAHVQLGLHEWSYARPFEGGLDELRISTVPRSSNWLWACWRNQSPDRDFCSYGPAEALTGLWRTVTITNGAHGFITPAGSIPVMHRTGVTFALHADPYYYPAGVMVDGVFNAASNTFLLDPVVADHAVAGVFAPNLTDRGTPEWWLARFGLTNDFDNAETGDPDGDGMAFWQEYRAGTDPTNGESVLRIVSIGEDPSGVDVHWQGGIESWQLLQRCDSLTADLREWVPIFTNPPPTAVRTNFVDEGAGRGDRFYRVQAHP